jgi:hypothetical protein
LHLVDCLYTKRVVAGELRKGQLLRGDVDACIDKANGVNVELNSRSGRTTIGDAVILLLKVVGVDRAIVSEVRLAPKTEAVLLARLVFGKSATRKLCA